MLGRKCEKTLEQSRCFNIQTNDFQAKTEVRAADPGWAWAVGRWDLNPKCLCPRVGKEASGCDMEVVRKFSNLCGRAWLKLF